MFGVLVLYLLRNKQFRTYRFFLCLHQIKPQILWQLVKLGLPIGVFSAREIGVYTAVSYLMGAWGTDGLAAHQIVFQTINLVFMVPLGMSFAATARVGQWLGQQHMAGYWLAFRWNLGGVGLWLGLLIAVAIAAVVFIWRFQTLTLNRTKAEWFC